MCKHIQSWCAKPISTTSILIKNVALSIPSYFMSCFLLPKTISGARKINEQFQVEVELSAR